MAGRKSQYRRKAARNENSVLCFFLFSHLQKYKTEYAYNDDVKEVPLSTYKARYSQNFEQEVLMSLLFS